MEIFQLDIRTLSFLTVLNSFVFGTGLIFLSYKQSSFQGIKSFATGLIAIGFGFLFLSLRNIIPSFMSIIVANALIVLGCLLLNLGLEKFKGLSGRYSLTSTVMLVAMVVAFIYYTYYEPSIANRLIIINTIVAIQSALCVFCLFKGPQKDLQIAQWMTALPFMLAGMFFVFRAMWSMEQGNFKSFMSADVIHQLAFIVMDLLIITSSFGLMWMISSRLEYRLIRQARRDELTQTYNRRALNELAPIEVSRATRSGSPISFIMLDIDHFKRINDTLGHSVGDTVLTKLATLLKQNIRKEDLLFRFGGEEFLIIVPDIGVENARKLSNKLKMLIENEIFCSESELSVTASFGIAELNNGESFESTLFRADEALYKAKESGRNRVEVII
ncbi:diguanylate cyclase [Vibrio sp. HN007]|uniref:GGDEF domain-containing protein n=1 Tax=Vibrio iocasae TaxID=3098914 RepID=UPI0035D4EEB3